MAQLLDSFDFDRFPYTEWFDGRIRRLVYGQDFFVLQKTMAGYLRKEARIRGHKLNLQAEPDSNIVIQAL